MTPQSQHEQHLASLITTAESALFKALMHNRATGFEANEEAARLLTDALEDAWVARRLVEGYPERRRLTRWRHWWVVGSMATGGLLALLLTLPLR